MANKETIEAPPMPDEDPKSIYWLKWFYNLYLLITGRQGRQNFINVMTNTKTNNTNTSSFFVNRSNGNAEFTGDQQPYLGPNNQLIVPTTIVASKRQILSVGAVSAYQGGVQTIPDNTPTVLIYGAEYFDEDSAFDLATGTFTPVQAGKYMVTASVGFESADVVADKFVSIGIAKNGATVAGSQVHTSDAESITAEVNYLVDMNGTTDYLQSAVQHNFGVDTNTWGNAFTCYFTAFKVD